MIDIENILKQLAKKRPIFHSEADFQHALAWEIQNAFQDDVKIRLEKPFYIASQICYVDLIVEYEGKLIPIELKYKVKELECTCDNNEEFKLKNHGAHNLNRYDFIKDIWRLENFLSQNQQQSSVGYAIFLTNDTAYRNSNFNSNVDDLSFRIHDRTLSAGELKWKFNKNKKKRQNSITLLSNYELIWKNYPNHTNVNFYYLLVEIKP